MNKDQSLVIPPDEQSQVPAVRWTQDQIELIKRTVAKGATDDELQMFFYQAKRTGLDPLANQIKGIKRWNADESRMTMAIQTGIDGYRLIAERTKTRDGDDGPYWCGPDGNWVEVWTKAEPPTAAKYTVFKKGSSRGFTGIADYNFYVAKKRSGEPNVFWEKGAPFMLAKCAEALALRKAYPQELSNIYTHEEMMQAGQEVTPAPQEVTPPSSKAGTGETEAGHSDSPPPSNDNEDSLQDYLYQLCRQIALADSNESPPSDKTWPSVLHALTVNSQGKYGVTKISDVPLSKGKRGGGTWSPLKTAIEKAELHLKNSEELNEKDLFPE